MGGPLTFVLVKDIVRLLMCGVVEGVQRCNCCRGTRGGAAGAGGV